MQLRGKTFAVAERLVEHNRMEEGQVYLCPEALLSAAEFDALGAGMKREIENLPPRFAGGASG
jgi:hypothetical protein